MRAQGPAAPAAKPHWGRCCLLFYLGGGPYLKTHILYVETELQNFKSQNILCAEAEL